MIRNISFLSLIIVLLGFVSCSEEPKDSGLPHLGLHDVEYKTVDGEQVTDTTYATIPEFSYLNQDSILVKSSDMKGKIWIADFFFSTCPTICPVMTTQMKRLNRMTEDINEHLQFLSFSINPDHDKPSVLRDYIDHHGIEASNWHFLTGDEEETHELGVDHFLVHAQSDEDAPGGFAHSPAFVLIDQEGVVRGVYLGTNTKDVDKLEKDLRLLFSAEYGIK